MRRTAQRFAEWDGDTTSSPQGQTSKEQTPMTIQRNPTTGRFERTWTPEKDAVLREWFRKLPDQELADRLNTSVDVLQHRAPKLGLRKYRLRRLPLSLQEVRDADRALNAGESLRSIARRLDSSHTVLRRALKLWKATNNTNEPRPVRWNSPAK